MIGRRASRSCRHSAQPAIWVSAARSSFGGEHLRGVRTTRPSAARGRPTMHYRRVTAEALLKLPEHPAKAGLDRPHAVNRSALRYCQL